MSGRADEFQRLMRDIQERAQSLGRSENPEREFRELSDSIAEMSRSMGDVTGQEFEGTDDAELVTAVVGGDGKLRKVDIGARAMKQLDADDMGPACLAAIRAARQNALDALQEMAPSEPAADMPDVNAMLEAMRNSIGEGFHGPR